MDFVGLIVDRLCTTPALSKTYITTHLLRPYTVEDVRLLLKMAVYLRKYVPNYDIVVVSISDFA